MEWNENLKLLREQKGYTQQELADILNMTRSSVANWEIGRREPKQKTFKKLAEIYNVSLDEIHEMIQPKGIVESFILRGEKMLKSDEVSKEEKDKAMKQIIAIYFESKQEEKIAL